MPNLRDFERRLGGLVEGLFSKTFRSGLQPIEIAKRVVREMDDSKQVAIKCIPCPVASGTILVDRLAEPTLGVEDTPRDVTESIIESNGRDCRRRRIVKWVGLDLFL